MVQMFALKVCTKTWNFDYASVGGVPEAYGSRRVFVSEWVSSVILQDSCLYISMIAEN